MKRLEENVQPNDNRLTILKKLQIAKNEEKSWLNKGFIASAALPENEHLTFGKLILFIIGVIIMTILSANALLQLIDRFTMNRFVVRKINVSVPEGADGSPPK